MRHIAIISDEPGWHGARLVDSLNRFEYRSAYIRLQDCSFDLRRGHDALCFPWPWSDSRPDAVFVRGVPGGSLEQVVLYLDILHAFEYQGIRVYNNVRSIERSVDKAMTSYLLQVSNIPTPPTWAGSDIHQAYQFLREGLLHGHRYVLKPLFGSQGKGLQLVQNLNEIQNLSAFQGVYYIQQFISPGTSRNKDWRLFVIGDQVLASMCREAEGWISNVANGARCTAATLPVEVEQMAVRACQVVGADYAGVDVMLNPDNQYVVTEVNSVPAWKGLQGVTQYNIADCIVDHFLSVVNQAGAERPHLVQI